MRGGMWELLNLAKFGTEAGQAQLVEERGSTDDLSVESNVERGPRPDVSSTSDGERWWERSTAKEEGLSFYHGGCLKHTFRVSREAHEEREIHGVQDLRFERCG